MSAVFCAQDEPAGSREEAWRHVLGETVGPLEPRGVPDRFVAGEIGALRIGEMSSTVSGSAERKAAHVGGMDPDHWKIDVMVGGTTVVEQYGREAALSPGDFTLVDPARPATWAGPGVTRLVAVVFPSALVPLARDDLSQLSGVRFAGDQGPAAIVSQVARQLPAQLDAVSAADGIRLGTAVADLLTVALASRRDREDSVPNESRQRALLLRIHAFIEERLGEPDLSPGVIAAAHYISVRYLHKLFETEQTTVADWVRRRRLERCRRDLLDPGLRSRPAGAIGARWGYPDPSHFNRTFKAAYGLPPGAFRSSV